MTVTDDILKAAVYVRDHEGFKEIGMAQTDYDEKFVEAAKALAAFVLGPGADSNQPQCRQRFLPGEGAETV